MSATNVGYPTMSWSEHSGVWRVQST